MLDLSESRIRPYDHQVIGVEALVKLTDPPSGRVYPGCFALFDEMGAGKTKQTIDAAQVLAVRGEVTRIIIVAPNSVRPVWFDPELGELKQHLWLNIPAVVLDFHGGMRAWTSGPASGGRLEWVVTNYDYIRDEDRKDYLRSLCGPRTVLILDESSAVKNFNAQQTKSCFAIRQKCGRIWELNGTPIANSPGDMYSQGRIMDPRILDCKTWYHFRSRYAILGGWQQKQIVGWTNLEDLQRRFAPYVLRRLKKDCLDLPEKLPPVTLTATLTEKTWRIYKEMRDEMVAWLSAGSVSAAPQAIVKVLRLAQVTSGFLGGVEAPVEEPDLEGLDDRPEWLPFSGPPRRQEYVEPVQEIGNEKLLTYLEWLNEQLDLNPNEKFLSWCRFRPELQRLLRVMGQKFPKVETAALWGGQKPEERQRALRLLDPRTTPPGPAMLAGITQTGRTGHNLTAAHLVTYHSNDCSLFTRSQSEDRVHRPGQRNVVSYFDIVAVGPKGQKTVDHTILKALRDKQNLANWTTAAWISALREE